MLLTTAGDEVQQGGNGMSIGAGGAFGCEAFGM